MREYAADHEHDHDHEDLHEHTHEEHDSGEHDHEHDEHGHGHGHGGHGHEHGRVDADLYGDKAGLRAVQISTLGMLLVSVIQFAIAILGEAQVCSRTRCIIWGMSSPPSRSGSPLLLLAAPPIIATRMVMLAPKTWQVSSSCW